MYKIVSRRILSLLNEAFITKDLSFDIFSQIFVNNILKRIYKFLLLILVVMQFTLANIKNDPDILETLKNLIVYFSQPLYNFVFLFIVNKLNFDEKYNKNSFLEKFKKIIENLPCYENSFEITFALNSVLKWIVNFSR
jgi:hypothetical protein